MPFVRITRDKRGYQYFSLIQPVVGPHGRSQQHVLYWFRSPPDTKVGREPFDVDTRRAIEAQYREIVFDWERLSSTPIPAVPFDWRERRRAEKTARRQERAETDQFEAAQSTTADPVDPTPPVEQPAESPVVGPPEGAPRGPGEQDRRRRRRRRRGHRPVEPSGTVQPAGSGGTDRGSDDVQ